MPELPEVETTRRGLLPYVEHATVTDVIVNNYSLRWPIDLKLKKHINNRPVLSLKRRGKYLLFEFENGHLIWHLGMSGSIRVITDNRPKIKHDHVEIHLNNQAILRYNDPRRFGAVIWTQENPLEHKLIAHLGPEPLSKEFNSEYLFNLSRKRSQHVKQWIMDSKVVVGAGNIYANESLFIAGIHPLKAAGKLSKAQAELLVKTIKHVLEKAIRQGGTTLRDFVGTDGKPGYFKQQLNVYGRGGEPCTQCGKKLIEKKLAQRTTVYCTHCQK